ncbi:MAG TPA: hypothetical protein VHB21_14135 [Minicystis sp.]|nr:hypothetical protein [Minicystis sp.]
MGDKRALGALSDRALAGLAAALLASMLAAALHDASRAWDVWSYHLPFAGRLVGILPERVFALHPLDAARFDGYPLLGELAQGVLWRVTGRPESVNLVAFASVPLLAWFARRRFGVPWHATVLALLAIPLVHVHATSAYVDLPANAAATVLVLLAIDAHASAAPPSGRTLALAALAAAIVINTKFQLHPFALAALVALSARVVPALARDVRSSGAARARARATLAIALVAAPVVFFRPLENLARHGNPYYPVRLELGVVTLDGPEAPYHFAPAWLARAPAPARFAASLAEVGLRPMTSTRRWTIDQWMPDDAAGARLGGFFHAYVLVEIVLLAARVARDRSRLARAAGGGFVALTAIATVVPQSHELRYYMVWMTTLVTLNLALAARAGARPSPLGVRGLELVSLGALAVVLFVTRAGYAYPSGVSVAGLVREVVDARAIDRVPDGGVLCVEAAPFAVLYASPFHGGRDYTVREVEHAADCAAGDVVGP